MKLGLKLLSTLGGAILVGCTSNPVKDANCILPGQIRQLGANMTYITQRQPVHLRPAELDTCEIRGGERISPRHSGDVFER